MVCESVLFVDNWSCVGCVRLSLLLVVSLLPLITAAFAVLFLNPLLGDYLARSDELSVNEELLSCTKHDLAK